MMMEQAAVLDRLDVLVERGIYRDREALVRDAMRALLRSKPELRRYLAVELYRQGKVSLARAAEISGVDIESFKEVLREAGISRTIPPVGKALRDEVDLLMRVRQTG
jgi:predicted HTH domain antitoxin